MNNTITLIGVCYRWNHKCQLSQDQLFRIFAYADFDLIHIALRLSWCLASGSVDVVQLVAKSGLNFIRAGTLSQIFVLSIISTNGQIGSTK